jgi:hypothetical protein
MYPCCWVFGARSVLHDVASFTGARQAKLFEALRALLPVIHCLGGERAMRETTQAILDTARWWS